MKKRIGKKSILTMLLISLLVVATACTGKTGEVVARVNNQDITKEELYQALVEQNGAEALDALISDKIIELELQKQKITVTEEAVQEELQKAINEFGGQEAFDQALKSYGYTLEGMKEDIRKNLKVTKMLEPQITITDDEMKKYFDENKDSFKKEDGTPSTYEESKASIKEILFNEKLQTAYSTWYDAKYNEYKVENLLNK